MPAPLNKYAWIALAVSVLLAMTAIAVYGVTGFSRDERIIAAYCRETRVGDALADARGRAERLGLTVRSRKVAGTGSSAITVSAGESWWSGASFCSLHHDGQRVTAVFHNPWYH